MPSTPAASTEQRRTTRGSAEKRSPSPTSDSSPTRKKARTAGSAADQRWNDVYERLQAYHEAHGDCNVPYEYKFDKPLGHWVRHQRLRHREGSLEEDRKQALDQLNFEYGLTMEERAGGTPSKASGGASGTGDTTKKWHDTLERLKAYKEEHGDTNVPYNYQPDKPLGYWVRTQRLKHKDGKLDEDRKKALDDIGFDYTLPLEEPKKPRGRPKKTSTDGSETPGAATKTTKTTPKTDVSRASASKDEKWLMNLEKLKAYKDLHGHFDIPQKYPEDQTFANWVRMQRDLYNYPNRGTLRPERLELLNGINFDWKTPKNRKPPKTFEEEMEDLKKYHAEHGHIDIPTSQRSTLTTFLNMQRHLHKEQRLSDDHKAQLDALGMNWEVQVKVKQGRPSIATQRTWEEYYAEVKEYHQEHHGTLQGLKKNKRALYNWMAKQKEAYHDQKLTQEQIEQLEALGMDWTLPPRQRTWDEFLATLVAFFLANGHANVPPTHTDDVALRSWVVQQRELFHAEKLSEDQVTQLKALLFDFSLPPKKLTWSEMLEKYKEREEKKKNGVATAAGGQQEEEEEAKDNGSEEFEEQLDKWVASQKERRSKGKLTPGQLERLKEAGFDFSAPKKLNKWGQQYESLKMFAAAHGNINNVKASYSEEPTLCHWVCRQRDLYHKMKLSEDQVNKLAALGIDWDGPRRYKYTADDVWQAHFENLKAFQVVHGHCGIPNDFPEDPTLWEWIHLQHVNFMKKRMPEDRIAKLESIGFVWKEVEIDEDETDTENDEPNDRDLKMPARVSTGGTPRTPRISWKQHYDNLKSYKELYGSFNVPDSYDLKLAEWVRVQRRQYKTQKGLLPEKTEKLNAIGFNWDGPDKKERDNDTPSTPKQSAAAAVGRPPNSASRAAKAAPPQSPMVTNPMGAAPNSVLAIASAAAAAAKKASQEEHREEQQSLVNQISQLRTAVYNLQALNDTLKEQLQEKDESHQEEKAALEGTLQSQSETMQAQEGTIQSQTIQIQQLNQQLETLREARRVDALRGQPIQGFQQQQQAHNARFYDSAYGTGNMRL